MASRIAGITIDIDADASKFQNEIKNIDKELKTTKSTLKDVDKLLKLDPSNTVLLTQKQKALKDAIKETKDRLQTLKDEQKNLKEGTAEWDALQREIIATEQDLKKLEDQYKQFGSVSAQQLQVAGKKMQDFGNKVEEVGKKLSKISGVAAGILTGLGKLGYDVIQTADDLATLSAQTGISVETLQEWDYASNLVDVSMETMTGSLKKLKKNMDGDAKSITALGVEVKNADGTFRDVNDVFYDTLDALSKIEDPTERDLKAMEIFGKSADDLAGVIDDGGKALKEYGQEAENLGLILDSDTIGSLTKIGDEIEKLKQNMKGSFAQLGATLVETFGPALEKVADLIGTVTEKIRNLSPEQAETIVKILGIVAVVGPLLVIGGKLISIIGSIVTAVGVLSAALSLPAIAIVGIVAAIAGLIAAGVWLYKHWDEVKQWATDLWEKLTEIWNNIKDTITNAIDTVKENVSNAWENMKTNVTDKTRQILSAVDSNWGRIKDTISTKSQNAKSQLLDVWDKMKQGVSDKITAMKDKISSIFDSIRNIVSNAVQTLKNLLNFNWSLPHLKMPHFRISGSFSLNPPRVPTFSVQWYKKAYENPMMFTSPTVLQTPYGAKGFGDGHGAEIVLGLNKLRELVGSSGNQYTFNIYASDNMNVTQLAEKIQDKLVQLQKQRDLAYA